jgi:glycine cleavage system pyridoxal-binding protein P
MLAALNLSSLDELVDMTVPKSIRRKACNSRQGCAAALLTTVLRP